MDKVFFWNNGRRSKMKIETKKFTKEGKPLEIDLVKNENGIERDNQKDDGK